MLDNILDIIPAFMRYFVPGYLFLAVRNFAVYKKPEEQTEYFFIPCVVSSHVFSTLWESLMETVKMPSEGACLIVREDGVFLLAILFGLLFGAAAKSEKFNALTSVLFGRTLSDNLFLELQKQQANADKAGKNQILYVRLKDSPNIYRAQIYDVVSPHENPILRLKYYTVRDAENTVIGESHENDENSELIIPYSDILTLEIKEKPRPSS